MNTSVESYSLVEDALKGSVFDTNLEPYEISVPPPRNKNIYSVETKSIPKKKPALVEPELFDQIVNKIIEPYVPVCDLIDWDIVHNISSVDYSFDHSELFKKMHYGGPVDPLAHEMAEATKQLPGMDQEVYCPANCIFEWASIKHSLKNTIIHVNDFHRWSRDDIADWLDELADLGEIDIDFPTPE